MKKKLGLIPQVSIIPGHVQETVVFTQRYVDCHPAASPSGSSHWPSKILKT